MSQSSWDEIRSFHVIKWMGWSWYDVKNKSNLMQFSRIFELMKDPIENSDALPR